MSSAEKGFVPDPKLVEEQLEALKGSDQNFEGWKRTDKNKVVKEPDPVRVEVYHASFVKQPFT